MKKLKTHYVCQECGKTSLKDMGRCPVCGAWNSYEEEPVAPSSSRSSAKGRASAQSASKPIPLLEAPTESERRLRTGIGEFDRVLGGGLVPGSGVLIGGEPGVGKSTLLMQAASALADSTGAVLYTSGEESVAQLKRRADRIGIQSKRLYLLAETDVDAILHQTDQMNPAALIVDSIQTAARSAFESAPGERDAGAGERVRLFAPCQGRFNRAAHDGACYKRGRLRRSEDAGAYGGRRALF